ncbi:MAG: nucleotidyltransferase family protein [Proteobacteria bacterium]|nr:nucleotidyltransferase family protein [Desulfobulbaceae bacterium]MBU4154120.1 nucleotidyltransferase family protein [Pseudomonadota bacterium]
MMPFAPINTAKTQTWTILLSCCQDDNTSFTHLCDTDAPSLPWHALCDMAHQEGLAPLLFWRLRQEGALKNLHQSLTEPLSRKYYATGATAAFYASQLRDLLPRCQAVGLPVIILKGAALAELYYPNPALRAMSDIDILVKSEDLDALNLIFSKIGYKTESQRPEGHRDKPERYLTTRIYRRQDKEGLPFHVHTHLLNSTIPNDYFLDNFPIAPLWKAAQPVKIAGTKALVLDPRHQVLHLAEHSLRVTHSLTKLHYLYDIDQVVRNSEKKIDWQVLCREAEHWQMGSFLYYPLSLASEWINTPVPLSALTRLQPEAGLLERFFHTLLANNIRQPGLSYLLHLSRQPSFKRQLAFVARTAFPPRHILARRSGIPLDQVGAVVYLRRVLEITSTILTTIKGNSAATNYLNKTAWRLNDSQP